MRNYIIIYINGQKKQIYGDQIFTSLSNYLREDLALKGTKIVCEEGDCGACTVLRASPTGPKTKLEYQAINSCITYLYLLDCCHIITIEGIKNNVQEEFIKNNGSQCGFCTPGFVMSMTALACSKKKLNEQNIRNELSGNLCRCTGYAQIIDAGLSLCDQKKEVLGEHYYTQKMITDLLEHKKQAVQIKSETQEFFSPTDLIEAQKYCQKDLTIFSSATDLGVQINKTDKIMKKILSTNLICELYQITKTKNSIVVGSKVSLTTLQEFISDKIPEFSSFLDLFASPQIKNAATLTGNIANASPIADTLPFLMVANAKLEILGETKRIAEVNNFYQGYKQLDLNNDELIINVIIPIPSKNQILKLYKVSKRIDLDISCVNAAFLIEFNQDETIKDLRISYGGVGPVVLRLSKLEKCFINKKFNQQTVDQICNEVKNHISPLNDVRGSKEFRYLLAKNLVRKFQHDHCLGVNSDS